MAPGLVAKTLDNYGIAAPKLSLSSVVIVAAAWTHGLTVGVAHGDESLKQFMWMTFAAVVVSVLAWRSSTGKRVVASMLFFMCVSFVMCFVSSVTWFRSPKQPPLPDIIHDLIPELTYTPIPLLGGITFDAVPDAAIGVLLSATLVFIFTNQHRWFIVRRFFVIYAALMALRSVCIVATSLPDPHPHCRDATPGNTPFSDMELRVLVIKALLLFVPVGQKLTCGDMVFSGHSMILILCGMVWHTYFKPKPGVYAVNWVKALIWVMVSVALFFIVATRLHYTLDVILAVFLAMVTWGSYHRIAYDVRMGQQFVSLYIVDGAIIYPAIGWLEGHDNPGAGFHDQGMYGRHAAVATTKHGGRPRGNTMPGRMAMGAASAVVPASANESEQQLQQHSSSGGKRRRRRRRGGSKDDSEQR